jgi:hypothetical protein
LGLVFAFRPGDDGPASAQTTGWRHESKAENEASMQNAAIIPIAIPSIVQIIRLNSKKDLNALARGSFSALANASIQFLKQ